MQAGSTRARSLRRAPLRRVGPQPSSTGRLPRPRPQLCGPRRRTGLTLRPAGGPGGATHRLCPLPANSAEKPQIQPGRPVVRRSVGPSAGPSALQPARPPARWALPSPRTVGDVLRLLGGEAEERVEEPQRRLPAARGRAHERAPAHTRPSVGGCSRHCQE